MRTAGSNGNQGVDRPFSCPMPSSNEGVRSADVIRRAVLAAWATLGVALIAIPILTVGHG